MTLLGDGKRPGYRSRVGDWTTRHPLIVLGIGLIVLGWLLIYEVVRIVNSRHTVAHDWAAGLLTGIAAAVVLTGVITLLVRRSGKTHKLNALSVLIIVATVSVIITFRLTTSGTPGPRFLPVSWLGVAGMAYVAIFVVDCLLLTGWAASIFWRKRRSLRAGAARPAGELPGDRLQH